VVESLLSALVGSRKHQTMNEKIDVKKWKQEQKEAVAASVLACSDIDAANKIPELHERISVRTEARERFHAAQAKLDLLQRQWGNHWRNQHGVIVE
jgi:hypothetical protein